MNPVTPVLLALAAYLAGSVNFSILLFRLVGAGDPRDRFSGNAGATNVARQLGKSWAALVLLLDLGRAVGVCFLALAVLSPRLASLAGFFLILGNQFPVFHGFRGGKGVANYLGFSALICWPAVLAACLAWLVAWALSRQAFIGSFFMVSVLAGGGILRAWPSAWGIVFSLFTLGLIFWAHRSNVRQYRLKGRDHAGGED